MKIKPNNQPCPVCRNHKGGKPITIRDDSGELRAFSNICNCPFCGRFLEENYKDAKKEDNNVQAD